MESVDKRMHFFDRQFLRATDLQAEQAYHIDRGRGHNIGFHSSGVVEGLLVVPSEVENHVNIEPGWAVDPLGREIVLVASRNNVPTGGAEIRIWIVYPDPEPLSDPSVDPGVTGYTRVHEEPVVSPLPPDTIPENGILLAIVTVSAEGDIEIDNDVRPLAGLKDGTVTEPTLADNAVTNAKVADNTLFYTKLRLARGLEPDLPIVVPKNDPPGSGIAQIEIGPTDAFYFVSVTVIGSDDSPPGGPVPVVEWHFESLLDAPFATRLLVSLKNNSPAYSVKVIIRSYALVEPS
jgi:hypothetical protein